MPSEFIEVVSQIDETVKLDIVRPFQRRVFTGEPSQHLIQLRDLVSSEKCDEIIECAEPLMKPNPSGSLIAALKMHEFEKRFIDSTIPFIETNDMQIWEPFAINPESAVACVRFRS